MLNEIIDMAKSLGFRDIKFIGGSQNLIVLFWRYEPTFLQEYGFANVSQYYIASNKSYFAAKKICEFLSLQGIDARLNGRINAKQTALKTGGFLADNSFYCHDELGTLTCIQIIEVNGYEFTQERSNVPGECKHCKKCEKMCPAGAIRNGKTNHSKCVRTYMLHEIPIELEKAVYQLFGCEICQMVCPMNEIDKCDPVAYRLEELIEGGHLSELKSLVGKNMAKKNAIITQAEIIKKNMHKA